MAVNGVTAKHKQTLSALSPLTANCEHVCGECEGSNFSICILSWDFLLTSHLALIEEKCR